ncbi:MAG TPA: hypothetical protein VE046_12575 [Steroidobacteraceae bacterium]|nr:hypothetical protein [Steroidobacteraceae bacterium]
MDSNEDLLRPSLSGERPAAPIFSTRAQFLTAFFGGGFAALAIGTANSFRLGRLGRDLPVVLALAAAYFGYLYSLVATPLGRSAVAFLGLRPTSVPVRLGGLAVFAILYLLHRTALRSAALTGEPPANPWITAIACMVAGGVIDWWLTHALATPG